LENYALNRLSELEAAPLEEHLLVCDICQGRLQEIDEFVVALKAAQELRPNAAPGWWVRVWDSAHSWLALTPGRAVLAGAMGLLGVVAVVEWPHAIGGPPVAVTLRALRGGDAGSAATAPAGRPLALAIEVPDIAACAQCRVEIVNDSGRTAWSGSASITAGRLTIAAPVALSPGAYWVRLYTGNAGPARECGLRLE